MLMPNFIIDSEISRLIVLFKGGMSMWGAARETGLARGTVRRWYRKFAEIYVSICPCGSPSSHQGWCRWRYERSEARQAFMERKWAEGWLRAIKPKKAKPPKREEFPELYPFLSKRDNSENHALLLAIDSAVPKGLPNEIRADVCQEIAVAVLTGELDRAQIQTEAGKFVKLFYKMYPQFGQVSLDMPVAGTEKMSWNDKLDARTSRAIPVTPDE